MSTGLKVHSEPDEQADKFALIDWEDVYQALASAQLLYGETTMRARLKGLLTGRRRGRYEIVLLTPGGHAWVLATFSGRQQEEAATAFSQLQRDPVEWSRVQDRTDGTENRRQPLVHLLREAQLQQFGALPGDAAEVRESTEIVAPKGRKVVIAAGALVEVADLWLGVQQGVVATPPGRPDLRIPLEANQLELVHEALSPVRDDPQRWTYSTKEDTWFTVGKGAQ